MNECPEVYGQDEGDVRQVAAGQSAHVHVEPRERQHVPLRRQPSHLVLVQPGRRRRRCRRHHYPAIFFFIGHLHRHFKRTRSQHIQQRLAQQHYHHKHYKQHSQRHVQHEQQPESAAAAAVAAVRQAVAARLPLDTREQHVAPLSLPTAAAAAGSTVVDSSQHQLVKSGAPPHMPAHVPHRHWQGGGRLLLLLLGHRLVSHRLSSVILVVES